MAATVTLVAGDGHELTAHRADPAGVAKGGIVVVHAVFGLTAHIDELCDGFAADGFAAIAPALFDRGGKGRVFAYDAAGVAAGRAAYEGLGEEAILADLAAAAAALEAAGRIAVLGFCTGGSWAWVAAAAGGFDAAAIFYGSHVAARRHLRPRCPTILHYGDRDHVVPIADVAAIGAAHPDFALHVYAGAGHAFFNPDQDAFDAAAARLARARTIAFLTRHLAGPGGEK